MKYTLIQNDEKVVSDNDFDRLVDIADRVGGGFVVETKDWDAQQKVIEAHRVHMEKAGIKLTGNNLSRIRTAKLELSDAEFDYLIRRTFIHGDCGSDIDVYSSQVNISELARIANPEQLKILNRHLGR